MYRRLAEAQECIDRADRSLAVCRAGSSAPTFGCLHSDPVTHLRALAADLARTVERLTDGADQKWGGHIVDELEEFAGQVTDGVEVSHA